MRIYVTTPPAERILARAKEDESGCWLWPGVPHPVTGYGAITVAKRTFLVHRLAYECFVGPIPDGMKIDHICRVRLCVRPNHLRLATTKQNAENQRSVGRKNSSGIRNVSWVAKRRKWQVSVKHRDRSYFGGLFDDLTEAAEAAHELRNRLFTHNIADRAA